VVEFKLEVLSGPGSGTTTQQLFVMAPGFDLSRDAINYMKSLEAIVMQAGEGRAMVQSADIVSAIRKGTCDHGDVFTYKGKDKVKDVDCDVYTFETTCGGPHPSTEVGEVCISGAVPFGVVRKTGEMRDSNGKKTSSSVMTLQDHGSGAQGSAVLLAQLPDIKGGEKKATAAVKTILLEEAYREGLVEAQVEIVAGSGGNRLLLSLSNKSTEALQVTIPTGSTRLEAGSPLNTLEIAVESRKTITLKARGGSTPTEVAQLGKRGAVEGKFTLSIYEGEPLFAGSITMGPLGH
jgi:hypothetical protein